MKTHPLTYAFNGTFYVLRFYYQGVTPFDFSDWAKAHAGIADAISVKTGLRHGRFEMMTHGAGVGMDCTFTAVMDHAAFRAVLAECGFVESKH